MHSLKSKITVLTICITMFAVIVVTALSVLFIIRSEEREADQILLLMCETGQRNLDYYFNSVEKSIGKVASFANSDLEGKGEEDLEGHVERVRKYFDIVAHRTNGVLTYYYRIDPEFSESEKGFWYTNLDGDEFTEHEVTDISKYDTSDTSKLVWFTVPKATGEGIWLPPYITDNLDARVISYNIPVYQRGKFAGVVGIEIDYSTMAEQVESIRLYNNGYAFLTDADGDLVFHPYIDVATLTDETRPEMPEGLLSESTFERYKYDGVEKEAAWLPLSNGMRLTVSAPVKEIDGEWSRLIREILFVSVLVLVVCIFITRLFTESITRPLQKLTAAAEQADKGNYDFELDYRGDDEVGRLTSTFKQLTGHVKEHITDLNRKVFVDALTSVRNKGAFSAYIEELQKQIDDPADEPDFAVCVFDCDDLKTINDQFGHEKGDIYLKTASRLICRVFQHSPVFRIGGDEFSVVLQNEDFSNREELVESFEKESRYINDSASNAWEEVHVTLGMSVYDAKKDREVIDTVRRADREMYEHKRDKKLARDTEG